MDTIAIGQYIQFLRKQKGMSQKNLAERLGVSFQAVSKWETGENLPDAGILLDLTDILDTTSDKLLNGGNIIVRNNKNIHIGDILEGFTALENLKCFFGEKSTFYRGAIDGINSKMNIDIEEYLKSDENRELLLAEAVIQYLLNGYTVNDDEIETTFSSDKLKKTIRRYAVNYSLFRNKARNYADYRPSYPDASIDLIFSAIPNKKPVIADTGAGTGKLSSRLIDRAEQLFAVEPNEQMRHLAEVLLSGKDNYHSISACAESTSLGDGCIDIITAGEAYHYFDNDTAKAEFRRILKHDGYIFLLWNKNGGNDYDNKQWEISCKYRVQKNINPSGITRVQRAEGLFGKDKFQSAEFDNTIYQTFEQFCGGWSSASYAPNPGDSNYSDFVNEARELFNKYAVNGIIETKFTTCCFWGQLI